MAILETKRLRIRKLTLDDAGFILTLLNSPGWLEFIGDRNVHTLEDAQNYLRTGPLHSYATHGFGLYAVTLPDGVLIGMCGLLQRPNLPCPDVGFAFLTDYMGSGYGYESARTVMDYAQTLPGITQLAGIAKPTNQRSIRLLEKLGMHFQKSFRMTPDSPESLLFMTTLVEE